jgi:hypothetical protein
VLSNNQPRTDKISVELYKNSLPFTRAFLVGSVLVIYFSFPCWNRNCKPFRSTCVRPGFWWGSCCSILASYFVDYCLFLYLFCYCIVCPSFIWFAIVLSVLPLLAHLTQRVRWAIAITWRPSYVVNLFKNLLLWKY